MSLVDIIVEVPSYSYRLTVAVPLSSTIRDVKQEIEHRCPGGPRTDKQRLIALGRELADDERIESIWKAAPRTVHLAVGHSGWTSSPPGPVPHTSSSTPAEALSQYRNIVQQQQQQHSTFFNTPQHEADYVPSQRYTSGTTPPRPTGLTPSASYASASARTTTTSTNISSSTNSHSRIAGPSRRTSYQPRTEMEYVYYVHQKALNALCPEISVPQQGDDPVVSRNAAVASLERQGWLWPSVLDEEFPAPSPSLVEYHPAVVDGQRYLRLSEKSNGQPLSPRQEHALKVLTQTFTILSMEPTPTPTVRAAQQQPQSVPIPPHVNQLLQQLGLPPMRAVGVPGQNAGAAAGVGVGGVNLNQNNAAVFGEIRQIPIRPLLAPLFMLVLRTLLLLYFVAPARKPIFGVLILGWMLYEIWQPIRNALRNGLARAAAQNGQGQQGQQGQQQANGEGNGRQGGQNGNAGGRDAGQPDGNAPPGALGGGPAMPNNNNAPPPARPRGPVTLEQQAGALFDTLANMNIEEEQRLLDQGAAAPATPPSFGHKLLTFVSLFVTTLHPAIWNRRREALRRREGVIRTEANVRNANQSGGGGAGAGEEGAEMTAAETEAARRREELRAQYARKPRWIQQYEERVLAEDWVDDSD